MAMAFWLLKTEPDTFSIQDLEHSKKKTAPWEGVRNYQARNFMRQMKLGDLALIYHSSCSEIGVVGIAEVTKEAYPDTTAIDQSSKYYDPKSSSDNVRWSMVDIKWIATFTRLVSLKEIKEHQQIQKIALKQKGSRLSIMPVDPQEFHTIKKLGELL